MYCLDTYALWEIQFENPKYLPLLSKTFVITKWTLIEFYKTLRREFSKEIAEYWVNKLLPFAVDVKIETLTKAVEFQLEMKKLNISLFDAIGYIYSIDNKLKFVTGDKAFKGLKDVLFISK